MLAKILDATQLGYYTFAFQTIERFVELVYTLPSSLLPSLTHLVAREERERLGYVFDQAFRLVQVAACVTAWSVFTFAPELTFWVGSPLFGGLMLNILLASGIMVYSLVHALSSAASVLGNRVRVGTLTLVNGAIQIPAARSGPSKV